jgi:hypothetical protein
MTVHKNGADPGRPDPGKTKTEPARLYSPDRALSNARLMRLVRIVDAWNQALERRATR